MGVWGFRVWGFGGLGFGGLGLRGLGFQRRFLGIWSPSRRGLCLVVKTPKAWTLFAFGVEFQGPQRLGAPTWA